MIFDTNTFNFNVYHIYYINISVALRYVFRMYERFIYNAVEHDSNNILIPLNDANFQLRVTLSIYAPSYKNCAIFVNCLVALFS